MQLPDRPEVEIQILRVELELLGDSVHRLFELHQRQANVLDFIGRQGLVFKAPYGLPLHELSYELDKTEDELDDRALNVFRFRIPA